MHKLEIRHTGRPMGLWVRLRQRLIYLPGAVVLLYGFWLSLSA